MLLEDCSEERNPRALHPNGSSPGNGERGGGHQSLQLDEKRARSLERGGDRGTRNRFMPIAEKEGRGVRHFPKSFSIHLENAKLTRAAEAVLDCAQKPVGLTRLGFEIEYGIHHMLDDLWAGDPALFRDVADEEDRDPCGFS